MTNGSKIKKAYALVLSTCLVFNPQIPPGLEQAIRALDYISVISWIVILIYLSKFSISKKFVWPSLALVTLSVAWLSISVMGGRSVVEPLRWILYFGPACNVLFLLRDNYTRKYIILGIIVGSIGGMGVLVVQRLGFYEATVATGLALPDVDSSITVLGWWRPPGMYSTNASPAIVAFSVPAAISLYEEGYMDQKPVFLAIIATFIAVSISFTRSTLVVVSAVTLIWILKKIKDLRVLGAWVLVVGIAVGGLLSFGPPGGWERWELGRGSRGEGNIQSRIETSVSSMKIAIRNPLGFGRSGYEDHLQSVAVGSTTHNGISYLSLSAGIFFSLFVCIYVFMASFEILRLSKFEVWIATTLLMLLMWEEYFRNPSFIVISEIVILSVPSLTPSLTGLEA